MCYWKPCKSKHDKKFRPQYVDYVKSLLRPLPPATIAEPTKDEEMDESTKNVKTYVLRICCSSMLSMLRKFEQGLVELLLGRGLCASYASGRHREWDERGVNEKNKDSDNVVAKDVVILPVVDEPVVTVSCNSGGTHDRNVVSSTATPVEDPDVNLLKEDVVDVPVWVKLHGIPVTAFSDDGLSAIATKLRNSFDA
ncbi:hypothetical protein Tco_0449178 [Tanacetum coccineum]